MPNVYKLNHFYLFLKNNKMNCNKLFSKRFLHQFVRCHSVQQNLNGANAVHILDYRLKTNSNKFHVFHSHVLSRNYLLPHFTIPYQIRNLSGEAVSSSSAETAVEGIVRNFSSDPLAFISTTDAVVDAQKIIMDIHSYTGLPWWLTIASTALLAKIVLIPNSIWHMRIISKLKRFNLEMMEYRKKALNITLMKGRSWMKKEKYNPATYYIYGIINFTLWASASLAIRNLCATELTSEEIGWIESFAVADPYFILPGILLSLNLTIHWIPNLFLTKNFKPRGIIANAARGYPVTIAAISCFMPSGVTLYWVSSAFLQLLQILLMESTTLKFITGTPMTDLDSKTPYRHAFNKLKSKLFF